MSREKVKILGKTPAELGYTLPPEWHPHAATWLSWPRPEGISFPGKYESIPENLARIIKEIAPREQVHINVPDKKWAGIVRKQLKEYGCPTKNVFFHHIPTNENWCRDHGPAFIVKRAAGSGQRAAIVDWGFNAWGGKYPPFDDDDAVPTRIAEQLKLPVFYPTCDTGVAVVMEGGSVDFNGAGTVMTTKSCLLNRNRNPRLSKK
ncbi:MAG TPA: agmatine deiminase family protein, partial [Tepidisphaeraceae bacterium]|nr:agmatine deiminase family protein [Tepidisphaeraceae bacterium]